MSIVINDKKMFLVVVGMTLFTLGWIAKLSFAPTPENFAVTFDVVHESPWNVKFRDCITELKGENEDFAYKAVLNDTNIDLSKVTVDFYEVVVTEVEVLEYTKECNTYVIEDNDTTYEISNCTDVVSGSHMVEKEELVELNVVSETKDGFELRNQWEEIHMNKYETRCFERHYNFNERTYGSYGYTYLDVKGEDFYDFGSSSWWDTVTYPYGYEILSTSTVAGMPISVNDTDGVGAGNIIIWTNNETSDQQWLVSTNAGATGTLAIGNSTDEAFWENETSMSGYNPTLVWDDNYMLVCHVPNITMNDSTLNHSLLQVGSPTITPDGVFGNALSFSGVSGNYYNTSDLGIFEEDWTIEFWINQTVSEQMFPFSWEDENEMWFRFDYTGGWWPADTLVFGWYESAVGYFLVPNDSMELNAWYYVVVVVNDSHSGMYYYLNGTLAAENYTFGVFDTKTKGNAIGSYRDGSFAINGTLDEVRISNVGRSEEYIEANWLMGQNSLMTLGAEHEELPQAAPQYSNNLTMLPTPQVYNNDYGDFKDYGFQVDWEMADNVTFEADFDGGAAQNYTMYGTNYISNISTTTYWINFTNENFTTASHSYKWYAYNISDGNMTEAVTYVITINNTPSVGLITTPPTDITYGTSTTASCKASNGGSPDEACKLDRNSTDVTATENDTAVTLPAGHWNYTAYYDGTVNYTSASVTTNSSHYVVNPNTATSIDMYLNGTLNANYETTWRSILNATCVMNRGIQNTFTMTRNGTVVGTQVDAVIEYIDDLPASLSYNISCNYTTQNYSSYVEANNFILNNAPINVTLYANGSTSNDCTIGGRCIIFNGSSINYTITTNESADVWLNLNYPAPTCQGGSIQNQTAPYENFTASNCSADAGGGDPTIVAIVDQTNYTYTSDTMYVEILEITTDETYESQILETEEQTITIQYEIPIPNATYSKVIGQNGTNLVATLLWNGTSYDNTSITMTENDTLATMILSSTFNVPDINTDTEDVTFFWNYSYNGKYNSSTAPISQEISRPMLTTCNSTYNTSSVFITFRDENTTDFPLINATSTLYLEFSVDGVDFIYNNSFINDTIDLCIFPAWSNYTVDGELTYDNSSYTYRIYTFDNDIFDNTTEIMDMLLIDGTLAPKLVKITVKDEYNDAYSDVVVKAQHWYNDLGIYKTAAAPLTDISGNAYTYLQLDDAEYRFLLYKDGTLLKTIEKRIIPNVLNEDPIVIEFMVTFDELIEWLIFKDKIVGTCYYVNATGNLTCTYEDTSTTVRLTEVQLTVKRYTGALQSTVIYSGTNTSSPTGSFVIHLGNGTDAATDFGYSMLGKLNINENEYFVIYTGFLDLNKGVSILFGNCKSIGNIARCREGVIITFLLTLMSALIGTMSPAVSILMMLSALGMSGAIGLWAISSQIIVGLAIMGAILIFRMRGEKSK